MGSNEDEKAPKPETSSHPAPDQTTIHVYPDWASMQAYYGPGVALPQYYNSTVAPGHVPRPFMWGPPQHLMAHYGTPYTAFYSPGAVYAHPPVLPGSHSHSHGVGIPSSPAASETVVPTPLSAETTSMSHGNADHCLMKNLERFDGLAMSMDNENVDSAEGRTNHGLSNSSETQGSSNASDGNTTVECQIGNKRSRDDTPVGGTGKPEKLAVPVPTRDTHSPIVAKLELKNSTTINTNPNNVPKPCSFMPSEPWSQNERELKRERRKQSNRESARRSRLRKQAEAEELAVKVENLGAENIALKYEIRRFTESSEKLRLQNAAIMEKLNNTQLGKMGGLTSEKMTDNNEATNVSMENLLCNNEEIAYDRNPNPSAKLRQLLDTSTRTDAVAAG